MLFGMTTLLIIITWIIPILLGITLHEAAHAWVANYLGDDTAKRLGRLSFNPFRHIDLVGTLLIPLFIAIVTHYHFVFGWAKPVPINARNFKNPRRDEALIAAAGPIINLLMAIFWFLCFKLSVHYSLKITSLSHFLFLCSQVGVLINLMLIIINLIPIPPLDGSRILASIMSPKYAAQYMKIEPYGFIILLVLLFSQILRLLIEPTLKWTFHFIQSFT